jgi:hypothetical protein
MKQKIIIIGALILLAAGIFFILKDLLFSGKDNAPNRYEYDMSRLRKSDSSLVLYKEVKQIKTSIGVIHGIAVDGNDRIYVCGQHGVEIFEGGGNPVSAFKIDGTALSIHIDGKKNIILGVQDHIEIWDIRGNLLKKWNPVDLESIITSIAATDNHIFAADAGKKVVYRYDFDGELINRIGEKDTVRGIPSLVIPSPYFDIGTGRDGELWVVNPGRHSLEAFTFDGQMISSWGKASMETDGFCGCCNPTHIAMLSDGSFVTSEKGIERVKVYLPDGKIKCIVATPQMFDFGTTGLDLAVDSKDRIVLLDPEKKLVRIFVEKNGKN